MDSALRARVDHLVYATPDLDRTVEELADFLGVRATTGGQHVGRGTRNALIALGPQCYLEIVGPDPMQPAPDAPRWFKIDEVEAAGLVAWAATAKSIDTMWNTARNQGLRLGRIADGKRQRPDGSWLAWRFTEPTSQYDLSIPFLIEWGDSIHPARGAAPGCTLADFFVRHPDVVATRRSLGLLRLHPRILPSAEPALAAVIDSPHGRVTLL